MIEYAGVYNYVIPLLCRSYVTVLYSGNLTIKEVFFSGASGPPSSVKCITTGRPATTVEWYGNGERIKDANSTTVLNDPLTTHYTHTLMPKREGGLYK